MQPVSVAGVIFSLDRSQVLLIQRRDVPVWVLPGGGIDGEESPEEAIAREVKEETGFAVFVDRLVGDYYPVNRLTKHTHLYECKIINGQATISSETKNVRFFPLDSLPSMPPPYLEWVEQALTFTPPVQKNLSSVTYLCLFKHLCLHPILVIRFLFARLGWAINT